MRVRGEARGGGGHCARGAEVDVAVLGVECVYREGGGQWRGRRGGEDFVDVFGEGVRRCRWLGGVGFGYLSGGGGQRYVTVSSMVERACART